MNPVLVDRVAAEERLRCLRREARADVSALQAGQPTVFDLLADVARSDPTRTALVTTDRRTTYGQLHDQSLRIAAGLTSLGVTPGARVGLALTNSVEYVATYFGVLAAGATVVPMHHGTPEGGLADACARFDLTALVLGRAPVTPATFGASKLIAALPSPAAVSLQDLMAHAPGAPRVPGGAAAILPTSGTTGSPKGVVLSHGALRANAAGIVTTLGLAPERRGMASLPFCFAFGNSVLLSHMAAGSSLAVDPHVAMQGQLARCLNALSPDFLPVVPALLVKLLASGDLTPPSAPALRTLAVAGGAPTEASLRRLLALRPALTVQVMYGQTEACARITCLPPGHVPAKAGSCGVPLPGLRVEILGSDGQVLPVNAEGEVTARGPSVMDGYFRDEQATDAVLRDGRLFTGDLGRMDEDGFLWITGRRSSLIKIAGFRVSPLEIEQELAEHPEVHESLVELLPAEDGEPVLAARVVLTPGALATERDLQAHCGRKLPSFKVPRRIRFVADLPRTAGGKIRRTGHVR